jgi:DNA-binding MarR family transcriptional regulator
MAHTLKRMERDGLVRRLPDPLDGRRAIIWMTDRARQLEDTLTRSAREVNALTVSGFTDYEVSLCYHLVARMIGNLEAAATPDRARRRAQQGGRTC